MSWIKRNLYFLIGSSLALVLLGLAGYYFYSKWQLNNDTLDKLNGAYGELDQLAKETPNPGNETVNNIEIARQQEAQVRSIIARERKYFLPIDSIPAPVDNVVSKEAFASALPRVIDELRHDAEIASVTVPKDYSFSFEAERRLTVFAKDSLASLSVQLGEVKAICDTLYQAKVNSLDNLRRARVSADDMRGPGSDYLELGSLTNRLAIQTPYEIVFHCFSGELAGVLSGFANSPKGFVVRALNVEPGGATASAESASGGQPGFSPPPPSSSSKGAAQVLVDEKQLKVTMELTLIKLLPTK